MTPAQPAGDVRRRALAAAGAADPDPAVHRDLRAELDAVPADDRGRAWREAGVLVDLAFRQRPTRTFRQLALLRERSGRRDDGAGFAAFWADCERALGPWTLTVHGYRRRLADHPADELWGAVAEVVRAVHDHGYPHCFATSGTLLGVVRDGAPIPHDDDVDLAVLMRGTPAEVAAEWLTLRARLAAAGVLDEDFEAKRRGHCRAVSAGGVVVDLFPAWITDDRLHVWPWTWGDLPADALLPLARHRVAGVDLWLPADPEPLLALNYGPGWRTPDPLWTFDWAAARQRFAPFLRALS